MSVAESTMHARELFRNTTSSTSLYVSIAIVGLEFDFRSTRSFASPSVDCCV
jgi:hypothetical protein